MALIGKIRNNSWLLILTLGVALAAFIIMDMTSADQMGGGPQTMSIGTIAGEEIDWRDFQRAEDILYSGTGTDMYERREILWDFFVDMTMLENKSDRMGLGVGDLEMEELQYGNNLSPVVVQRFMNPQTGQVDRNQLNEIRDGMATRSLDPNLMQFWRFQQREIKTDRLQAKIEAMVRKGLYTPNFKAESLEFDKGTTVSFDYVNIPFSVIPDGDVEVSDSDLRDYLRDNRRQYERKEESRRVGYVTFEVLPTSEDSSLLFNTISELKNEFEVTRDDSLFTDMNYGYFDVAYYTEDQLPVEYADRLFNMEKGQVTDPFIHDGNFTLLKLVDKKMVPDSVRSRHILRPATDPVGMTRERAFLDSLKTLIETGVQTFDSLAIHHGTDATSADGGDLGYTTPGEMVAPFNDHIFYKAEPGDLHIITTQFGLHLVEVTDRIFSSESEGVRYAAIEEAIVPSEETQNIMYEEVLGFIAENRSVEDLQRSADENPALSFNTSNRLERNDYSIQGLGANTTSRDIVRWAFSRSARVGNVSPEIYAYQHPEHYFTDKYLVVGLSEIEEAGLPSVSSVRNQIQPLVLNKKKGEKIKAEIEGMNLPDIASRYNQSVSQAFDVNLGDGFISGIGNEPAVIGALKALDAGEQSSPIIGNSGVFSIRVSNKTEPPVVNITGQVRRQISREKQDQVSTRLMESLRDNISIEDQRHRLY